MRRRGRERERDRIYPMIASSFSKLKFTGFNGTAVLVVVVVVVFDWFVELILCTVPYGNIFLLTKGAMLELKASIPF